MVRCPQCDVSMSQVTARANPGSLIQLDQCAQCGGIWCDKWELFPIQTDEATRLEQVDQELLRSTQTVKKKTLYCPRCTARLANLNDPLLDSDIQLQRCPKCDGMWLNRGQFSRYKNFQKRTRLEKMGAETLVEKLPEVCQDPKSWVVTGTQGMFAYPRGMEESDAGIGNTLGGAFKIVLQVLMRMVLGI
jgi:Zn-finger nucleic acid-binding protein